MDHDVGVGQREPLALRATGQENGSHARSLTDAVGVHVTGQPLHRVINGQTRGDTTAGGVDVEVDVLLGIGHLEEEELSHDDVGHHVIDGSSQENDPVDQEAAVQIVALFTAARLLDDVRNIDKIAHG